MRPLALFLEQADIAPPGRGVSNDVIARDLGDEVDLLSHSVEGRIAERELAIVLALGTDVEDLRRAEGGYVINFCIRPGGRHQAVMARRKLESMGVESRLARFMAIFGQRGKRGVAPFVLCYMLSCRIRITSSRVNLW